MQHRPEAILIAMAWERAKGELRAAVAALGALPPQYGSSPLHDPPSKYELANEDVEAFIKAMDAEERFNI